MQAFPEVDTLSNDPEGVIRFAIEEEINLAGEV